MKRFFLLLAICLCCASMWAWREYGTFSYGERSHVILYTIDEDYNLAFWVDSIGGMRNAATGGNLSYTMYDAKNPSEVPWYPYASRIRSIQNLGNVDNIGSYAFYGMTNLRYLIIPDDITLIGDSVFIGCTNLKTIELRHMQSAPEIGVSSFMIDKTMDLAAGEIETWVNVLVVPNATYYNELASWDENWERVARNCRIVTFNDTWNDVTYIIGESDSISQGLKLSIDNWTGDKIIQVPDRTSDPFPWDAIGDQIEDLVINDNISYIGRSAFTKLTNLKSIQFRQRNHPIDSMSLSAFDNNITPWKFALGDPQDGPIVPPVLKDFSGTIFRFKNSTVLYVPDSTFEYKGEMVRSIDLYKQSWGKYFHTITDRTVDTATTADNKIELKWLPLEMAEGYRLTIREISTGKDTSIVFPATGLQGLIDWANMDVTIPAYLAARRAPKGDGGGGTLVIVIEIKDDSGDAHNDPAVVSVSGPNLKSNEQYEYIREVLKKGGVDAVLTKKGTFNAPENATAIEQLTVHTDRIVIYDMLGRVAGDKLDALSDGIYILDKGGVRTTILLRR